MISLVKTLNASKNAPNIQLSIFLETSVTVWPFWRKYLHRYFPIKPDPPPTNTCIL